MDDSCISLLYPDEAARRAASTAVPVMDDTAAAELGLYRLLEPKTGSLSAFFSCDEAVIRFRQQMFSDLLRLPEICDTLQQILPVLCDITELRRLGAGQEETSGGSYLYSITEIELYVSLIDTIHRGFAPISDKLESEALTRLWQFVRELAESDYYRELNGKLSELAARMHEVRSVTVGVNLDAQLRPESAGVLSVNAERFHSGTTLDKILRMSFRRDAMTCIAALSPLAGKGQSDNRREALGSAFLGAFEEIFRSSVRGWRAVVSAYVLENTDFLLRMMPEIGFVTTAVTLCRRLADRGCALTFPTLRPMADKVLSATGLYNPDVALRTDGEMVKNDFAFDDVTKIFVITGPNRGGKSVHTVAVGLCQAMAQLGLPVAADACEISPADRILLHFPEGADDTIDKGRLGEECARLRRMFEEMTGDSLLLLDESLSSTGAYEATYIAADVLRGFGQAGCRCVFSTHLHDLAAEVETLSRESVTAGGVGMDTLVAEVRADGTRSFRVVRAKPDGRSYARDIAEKYGLGAEQIRRMTEKGKKES